MALVIRRDRSLRDTDDGPDAVHAAGTTATFLIALAVSTAFPAAGYWPLLLLIAIDPVVDLLRSRRSRSGSRN
jgi:hypothetical protein